MGRPRPLRIGTIPTAVPITTLVSERFILRHPLARVRVEEMSSREVSRRLADFQIDVGVTYGRGGRVGPGRFCCRDEDVASSTAPAGGRDFFICGIAWRERIRSEVRPQRQLILSHSLQRGRLSMPGIRCSRLMRFPSGQDSLLW